MIHIKSEIIREILFKIIFIGGTNYNYIFYFLLFKTHFQNNPCSQPYAQLQFSDDIWLQILYSKRRR